MSQRRTSCCRTPTQESTSRPDVATQVIDGKTIATLTFSGTGTTAGSLDDGNYSLTVLDTITDTAGNQLDGDGDGSAGGNATDEFFRLYGDINGDRTVNIIDFFQFRNAFGSDSELDETLRLSTVMGRSLTSWTSSSSAADSERRFSLV